MNSKELDLPFIILGIIGSFILFVGLIKTPPQIYYIVGSFFLLITAIHFKLFYFIALEIILIAGHGAILLGIGTTLQAALPILLSLQLLLFYLLSGQLENFYLLIGIVGIALLSIGCAYENQWIFLLGSSGIAIYAYKRVYQGKQVALLWAIVNSLFALVAAVKIIIP